MASDPLAPEGGIVNLTSLDEVGQAVTMHSPRTDVILVGRITRFSGTPFDGLYPVIHARTPGGSDFYGGRVWLRPPTPSEYEKLVYYEQEALSRECPKNYWEEGVWPDETT